MDSIEKLLIWVIASDALLEKKTAAKKILLEHFADDGMDEYKLDQIVGTHSMLSMIIAPIRYAIAHDTSLGWCEPHYCHSFLVRMKHDEIMEN